MHRHFPGVAAFLPVLALALAGCMSPETEPEKHDVDFFNNNAQHFYEGAHYQRALGQFEKAIGVDPDNITALLGRAWSLLMLGEAQIMAGEPEGAENIQIAGEALRELESRGIDKDQFKVHLGLGKVHARMGDLYDNRLRLTEGQMAFRPEGGPESAVAGEARQRRDLERQNAWDHFHRVLSSKDNPAAEGNLVALLELSRLSVIRKDYESAHEYGTRYLEQVRKSKDLWVESMVRLPKDRPLWEAKLAGAVAKEVEVRDLLANTLFKLGRLEEAMDQLHRVILLAPHRGDAYINRAIIREELGEKAEAVEDLKSFLVRAARVEMDPGDPRAIEATKRLMRLEKELGLAPTVTVSEE